MTNRAPKAPRLSRKGHDRLEDRLDRQAQALRANLARRKQQVRARTDGDTDTDTVADAGAPATPSGGDDKA